MANHQRDRAKERFWRQMLRRWQRSGLSVRDFCARHQLSEANFYAWRRTLAQREPRSTPSRITRPHPAEPTPTFVPVQLAAPPRPPTPIEIVVGRPRLLRLLPGFDADTLRQVLALLEASSC
jgi:transposase